MSVRVTRKLLGGQHLDGHRPVELRILGLVDDSHAAPAKLRDDSRDMVDPIICPSRCITGFLAPLNLKAGFRREKLNGTRVRGSGVIRGTTYGRGNSLIAKNGPDI